MAQTKAEPTRQLIIDLPESMVRLLQQMADQTHQSPEALAAQSIAGNLPPSVENAPPETQADLLAMQTLSVTDLLNIAHSQISQPQQDRHTALLEKHQTTSLTPTERQELSDLRQQADQLMLRKAYAWAVLRWRGQRTPALEELPLA